MLLIAIIIGYMPIGVIKAEASENITLNLISEPEIDIVLTVGNTNINAINFERDLKSALQRKGIDANKVKIQAIETQELDVQDTFTWDYYGHDNCEPNYWCPRNGKRISATNNGRDLYFDGYGSWGYADFMYLKNTNPGKKTFTFQMNEGLIDYHAMEGAGFLFNTDISNGNIKGYAIIIGPEIRLYQIDTTVNNFFNSSTSGLGGKATKIATFNRLNTQYHNIKIEVDKNYIDMWDNGQKLINNYRLPTDYGTYGFGPIASHSSHGCNVRSNFTFQNLKMEMMLVREFKNVIREPQWRYGSKRFLVNLENDKVADFDNPSASGEILTRLINEEIHYLAIGSNTNKAQAESFIARNNNNGKFYSNSNYNAAIEGIADYIKNQMPTQESTGEEYVLMGEPMKVSVNPPHLMKNTQTPEYPQGRWRIDHDYEFYDNNLGQAIWANQWQKDLILTFDKPGKYEIFFENINPEPRFIYVHRRPVANFSLNVTKSGSNYNVSINDLSYDPDKEFSPDRGIAEYEWKWKETTATNWTNGRVPNTLPLGKNYIVQLRVKDHQGEWSIPEARYITTDSILTPPVANFNVSPNPVSMYETLTVNDNSYDPAGRAITQREWIVTKDGTQVYKGSTPLTSFLSYGEGRYKISLRVKNDANLWSETFAREIEVTPDNTAPTSIVNPTRGGPTNKNITVNIQFDDEGGSGFDSQRYAVTESITPPASGWSAWSSSKTRTVTISQEGKFYLHIEAKDKAGNLHKRTMGEYHIDKTPPVLEITQNPTTPTNKNVVITVKANDTGSGIKEVELSDGRKITQTETTITVEENGVYTFKTVDNAGNETTKSITVSNIDKVPPVITIEPYETNWTNKNITVKAKVDKGTLNKTSHTFTENGSFEFVATDAAGNIAKKTITITNIDKTPPTKPVVNRIDNKLVLTKAIDNESGINKHMYSLDDGEWAIWTNDIDISNLPDGHHVIKVKAIDKATNETETSFSFLTEYEAIKDINEAIDNLDKEVDNLIDYTDLDELDESLDKLQDRIDNLPDGDDKDKLQDELDKLRERLQKEADKRLKEATRAVELAETTKREPYIQRAKDKVAKLKDGPDKEALKDRIRAIEHVDAEAVLLEEATKAVELAEATRRNVHIQDAKEKVSKLKNGPDKTALENRIKAIEYIDIDAVLLEEATKAVELAEATRRDSDIQDAKEKVSKLKNGPDKTALENRIKAIEHVDQGSIDFKDAELAVKLAEATKREPYIGKAKAKVRLLASSPAKEGLELRLFEVEKLLNQNSELTLRNAERIVSLAEKLKRESNLENAKKAIERLKPSEEKTNFLIRLETVARELEGKKLTDEEKAIIEATYYVELAETYQYKFMIRKAMQEVEKLPEGQDKQSLINRLNSLNI